MNIKVAVLLVEMPKSVVVSVLFILPSDEVLTIHRKPRLLVVVIAVIEPKPPNGGEALTVHAHSAMLVDYTMPNSHGRWGSTKHQR